MEEKDNSKEEISLLDIFLVLVKRKGFILKFTFIVAILSIIVSLILPKVYKAEALLLLPKPVDTGLSSLAEKIGLPSDLAIGSTPGEFWSAVLKSRTVLDDTIDKFGLLKEYKERWKAREALKKKIEVSYDKKSNLLTLAVLDKDPKVAANMANFLIDEMKKISKNVALTPAAQKRAFFEEELQKVKEQLTKAEEDLKKFQEKTKTVALDEQLKASISAIVALKAQIAAKETELKSILTYATEDNPQVKMLRAQIEELRTKLADLERKSGGESALISLTKATNIGLDYLRVYREYKFREELYSLILKLYEKAKLEESLQPYIIQVIDYPVPPEHKYKPKRALIVIASTFSALFVSIFLALILESIERAKNSPESREKLEQLKKELSFRKRG